MGHVLLATCAELPVGDEDAPLLDAALAALGIESSWAIWDDPGVDWGSADLVVVRSTWDYTARLPEFLRWASSVPRLVNPAAVLEWNTDKRYLLELEGVGVPVTPTTVISDPAFLELPSSGRVVVKPSVGAGSKGAGLFEVGDVDQIGSHAAALLEEGLVPLLQPYVDSVDARGETDLVFLDGAFSHAVAKGAMLRGGLDDPSGLFVAEQISERTPSAQERETAEEALVAVQAILGLREPLLYARIDLVTGPEDPMVLEVELCEPSLFLSHEHSAPAKVAAGILRRLQH